MRVRQPKTALLEIHGRVNVGGGNLQVADFAVAKRWLHTLFPLNCERTPDRSCLDPVAIASGSDTIYCSVFTIHGTPKRSVHMPKPGDQKVFSKGIVMLPPSDSALNIRSLSDLSLK